MKECTPNVVDKITINAMCELHFFIQTYNGLERAHIRTYYKDKYGKWSYGKGVCWPVEDFSRFVEGIMKLVNFIDADN